MVNITHSWKATIVTKYLGPTNCRGSRIKADAGDGRTLTVPYDSADRPEDCHANAAKALCEKFGWTGTLVSGATDTGYVFVFFPTTAEQ